MNSYLLIIPVVVLVAYSQLIVKWRSNFRGGESSDYCSNIIYRVFSDPYIVSAYIAALLASFGWLYVVTKLPVSIAFPIYIGSVFVVVLVGGGLFFSEDIGFVKIIAVLLILSGIVLGIWVDH